MTFPDPRFFSLRKTLTPAEAAEIGGGTLVRRGEGILSSVADAASGGEGALAFAEKPDETLAPATVLIVPDGKADTVPTTVGSVIEASSPRLAYAKIAAALFESKSECGCEDDTPSKVADSAMVHPTAVVAPGATVADGAVIGPYAVIGHGVLIGAGTRVGSHVSINHATVGAGCSFSSGVRIGEAGFGYVPGDRGAVYIPQLGAVRIGDGVDIGANTTVDRGMLTDTEIGDGTKIDNLCQIAHNCKIGRSVLIASHTGVSGSCTIGDGVMMGGQVGMGDHVNVGAGAVLAARSGLMRDVEPGGRVGGTPAKPFRQWMKEVAALSRLAEKKR
ncbi:MAG: UDP-3-O-(3-hydroxymyristoyl)glucosamine N-acyltransferase [Pseudomonadota bacterium]